MGKLIKFNFNVIETNKCIVDLILNTEERVHVNEMILNFSEILIGTKYCWNDLIEICEKRNTKIHFHLNDQQNYKGKGNVLFNRFGGYRQKNLINKYFFYKKKEINFKERCIMHQKTIWTPGKLIIGGFANGEGRTSVYPNHIAKHNMIWRDFSLLYECNKTMDNYFSIIRKNYMIPPKLPLINQYSLPSEKNVICEVIKNSKKYVYIEIQYFGYNIEILDALIKRLKKAIQNKEKYRIFIISHTTHIYNNKHNDISLFSLGTVIQTLKKKIKNYQNYIFFGELLFDNQYKVITHSKLVIVDNKKLILSSTNWFKNNLEKGGDTDLGIIVNNENKEISEIMNRIANINLNTNLKLFNYLEHFEKAKNNEGRYINFKYNKIKVIAFLLLIPKVSLNKYLIKNFTNPNLKEIKNTKYNDSDTEED